MAIVGAGKLGTTIARLLLAAGYDVRVTSASGPGATGFILDVIAPGARAQAFADAVGEAEVVILALPLSRIRDLDAALLAGKLVLDATNHWESVDGRFEDLAHEVRSTQYVADLLSGSRVVKAFNHLGYHDLDHGARPPGDPARVGMAIAGGADDLARAGEIVDAAGFEPVRLGTIADSAPMEPGGELFGRVASADDIRARAAVPARS
ncbi:NADPH-dependent F420 reductase [Microbacterium gorillae]|uniref:NADPH-dependent F420 reductase n=1 Tax=Microbacterium gorillae TaxID=1231063 RepID=UPI001E33E559|nr:NAD(P)-binding domain-containing protein [Microbacterium gorillae]